EESHSSEKHDHEPYRHVKCQASAKEPRQLIFVLSGCKLGDVSNNGGADPQIEVPIITCQGKHKHPQAECVIAQPVKDERRQEETDARVDRKAKPGRADVFGGL